MKKMLGMAAGAALALAGGSIGQAMAQSEASAVVGTPDSANMVIIEQGYEVVAPTADTPANNGMEALPGDPGVEVAPAPDNAVPAVQNKDADGTTNSANPEYQGSVTVDETVTEEVVD